MPDARLRPVFRWGEELRRRGTARRAGRFRMVALTASWVALLLLGTLVWTPRPMFVWNASASSAMGLYLVTEADDLRPGQTVLAWAPAGLRDLAARRRYLPLDVPLVKRVAALAGDLVCARGNAISVNGRPVTRRRPIDGLGRPLPAWEGCHLLLEGETFLLAPIGPESFDGRYFGVTSPDHLIGRARLLWAW